jgi:uroporphyrin-III C-methyltransferase/precorrin-2 dehydrogenase/sirohydrochlorin ferrochelatase/uroporphyrin-III C-methyltransferase
VSLVGAGPGDPDLLTVKAVRLLREAEVVVYDRLVSEEVLALVPRGAARLYVGKATGRHTLRQDEINRLLADVARTGKRVVRLKGGDPFVFGRGSEEAEYLARHGIRFEVVPGVTAASGCAAAVNIPLTHRGLATSVRYVTGHLQDDGDLVLDWQGLANPQTTLVIYMGSATLRLLSRKLIEHGLPADTPAAAVSQGTTPRQQMVFAQLHDIADRVIEADLSPPMLTIIGKVVDVAAVLAPARFRSSCDQPLAEVAGA